MAQNMGLIQLPLQDRNRRLPESTRLPLPSNDTLLCLIPRGEASPYTSVLACTRSGALRFWDQLTVGLDRFRSGDVAVLNDGEFITSLENCEVGLGNSRTNASKTDGISISQPFGVLLATNLGRLIRVTVPSGTMDYQAALTAELLQRSRGGLFSKVGNLFGSGSQAPRVYQDDVVRIVAGKTQGEGSRSGRNVFVIGKRVLRRWVISRSGAHDVGCCGACEQFSDHVLTPPRHIHSSFTRKTSADSWRKTFAATWTSTLNTPTLSTWKCWTLL